ncbi:MAG: PilZ domain-containing protein, partial [Alphaproteobacteria bacterium]|nr:PilZ domain-containing protein [Alphaproteobacteria bacterium]
MVAQPLARDITSVSPPLKEGLRRFERIDTYIAADLVADGTEHPCFVVNISAGGALVHCGGPFPSASELFLRIADFAPLPAQHVRANRGCHGLSFLSDPREVQSLVQRITSEPGLSRDRRLQARRRVLLAGSFYLGT